MNPIPIKLRKELSNKEYYQKCCLSGKTNVKIDWHHAWTYAGKQINEEWNIMPIWEELHNWAYKKCSVHNSNLTKRFVQYLALKRANIEDLICRMPKKNWKQEYVVLTNEFRDIEDKLFDSFILV